MARLLLFLLACAGADMLPDFHFRGGNEDHYKLGFEIGRRYEAAIKARVAAHETSLKLIFSHDGCQQHFKDLLATHQRLVPQLLLELQGIAEGSKVAFETLCAISLQEELGYCKPDLRRSADHCSDYMLCNAEHCLDAHNEDGDLADKQLFAAFVQLGASNFTVLNYAGDLLGGMSALAFNAHGLAFSLNWLGPASCDTSGLGRNFVSRMLLDAQGWDEAKAIISQKHAIGHNYQLMDFRHRRIANFEVAQDQVSERPIREAFFHANQYQTLDAPGQPGAQLKELRLHEAQPLPRKA
ncbi:unnamed protein product [Effrenium voratum]|uniref:Peptidase C45 hydrolase domain-containing protein n=1 Tax=Effrenium voratum TaxID=2562239 RepID=A0AA36MX11_9DINO|nr:unnamed protein product [Effrenium voratum]